MLLTNVPKSINIKLLTPTAKVPQRADDQSAGYDLYADLKEPITIQPNTCYKISSGIAIELPDGTFGGIFPRSGLATKRGLRLANSVAVIDSSYRGDVLIALFNDSPYEQTIYPGDRIAQLIILPYLAPQLMVKEKLSKTERGEGGFGHSGLK